MRTVMTSAIRTSCDRRRQCRRRIGDSACRTWQGGPHEEQASTHTRTRHQEAGDALRQGPFRLSCRHDADLGSTDSAFLASGCPVVPTELAPVTPSVLKWARQSVGAPLTLAAQRAGVTTERVEAWEAGEAEPTVAKLRVLAKLYQRPLAVFFLPEPPLEFDALRDFRKLPD